MLVKNGVAWTRTTSACGLRPSGQPRSFNLLLLTPTYEFKADNIVPTHCILTGVPLTSENDSRAHIVPSALGGRLKPKGILSDAANETLNEKIDLPLIRAFQPIMTMLGGSRDRGDNPTIHMSDETGRVYNVAFGEPLALAKPEFSMRDVPGSVEVRVSARTRKELRILLGKVKKRFPAFDIEEAVQQSEVVHRAALGRLHVPLQIGPVAVFPAAFAALSIFAVHHGFVPHPGLSAYVDSLELENDERAMPPDTFYWHVPQRWFDVKADVSHVLALIGDAAAGRMIGYVEYFNIACVAVAFPYKGSSDFRITHAVDVLEGREAVVQLDEATFSTMSWAATHTLGDTALYADVTRRMDRVIEFAQRRGRANAIEEVFNQTVGPIDGRALSEAERDALALKLAAFIVAQME